MVGKITTVLIKKEAEAYRVQGLHQEALSLYDHLLSSSPNIDPALKEAIKSQIEGICEDLQTFASQRSQPLSINEVNSKIDQNSIEQPQRIVGAGK